MKRKITDIIIHCAATPNGKDIRARDIDAMHKARGFKRSSQASREFNPDLKHIGYHYVICVDGTIETGRGVEEIGAHVQGNNSKSIGICMIGLNKYTKEQWKSLKDLVMRLARLIQGRMLQTVDSVLNAFKEMGIKVAGHRDYSPDYDKNGIIDSRDWLKTCPSFDVKNWLKNAMAPVAENLLNGL